MYDMETTATYQAASIYTMVSNAKQFYKMVLKYRFPISLLYVFED